MSKRIWTPEKDAELVALYHAGKTRQQVADALGLTMFAVAARADKLRKKGVAVPSLATGPKPDRQCPCGATISRKSSRDAAVCGVCQRAAQRLPRPDDLVQVATGQAVATVAAHYRVSIETARGWMVAAGVQRAVPGRKPRPNGGLHDVLAARAAINRQAIQLPGQHRHGGQAGRAAEFLQRRDPIWRCTPAGTADPRGSHWRFLGRIRSDAEIIERAEAKGWEPDAWRALSTTKSSEGAHAHA